MSVRYTLRDRKIFRWIMDNPGRGKPYSIRNLAEATSVSRTQIGGLLSGSKIDLEMGDAHSVTQVLGVALLVLFAPSASQIQDDASTESRRSEE
jgi:hypothetical protein